MLGFLGWIVFALISGLLAFRLLRFASTPLLRRLGVYRYYSPLLLTMPAPGGLQLHMGTSFDFLRARDVTPRHSLRQLTEGLLGICSAVERGDLARSTVIVGTTYFLRDYTLRRMGLEATDPGPLQRLLALAAWAELNLLHSIAKGAPRAVRLERLRKVRFTAADLLACRPALEGWRRLLIAEPPSARIEAYAESAVRRKAASAGAEASRSFARIASDQTPRPVS
jgi:hypothetical protein